MWQAAKKARQRVLRLEISATRLSVDLEACGKRPKRRANVFCASKSAPCGFLWIWKHVASGQKGAPTCSAPRNQRHAAFCGFGSMWQAAKKARQRVLRLEISAMRLSVDLEACGKRPKRRANVFCASKSAPRGFLWIWKHVASGQKGAPTCSAPRNQRHAAFCGFGSMWQAAKKARQRVLRLEISATRLSVDLEACGKRPKRRANVFCASKSAPRGFLWIWKPVASGQKGAPTCSAPRNQCHAAFCGFGSMWQAAKKARQRVLRLEISATRLSVDLEACGKRPKRRANVFCASKSAPRGFLWIWKHVASGQKGAPTCSAPRNQRHAAFCGFGSMWQAAKKARQRVLRLEISATRLSVDLEACGKRPKRRANVFCASKSVPRGFLWIWKHVASGQKGAPTCSAPRNQRHAAFCRFGSMWQAAKKARQRVLRLEISATRLSVDLEACGKRPKRRANVFCASKSAPRGFLWIWKHVASGQKGAPTCSAPRNQRHAAFCGFGSMWQAAKKARQRVLRLEISATRLSVDLEACGKRPKRRANVFCASKSAPCGFLWIWKPVASGQKGAPTCSAPRNQRHAAFCGFGSMWQAAKKARQRVLRLEISATRLSVDLEACGKRPKRRANVFCASKSAPCGFLWIWKHVASGQKGAPTCSAPRNQCHAAFCGFGSMWQAAKKARQRVLRLEISATRLSVDLEACGKRPKRRANVFCASKSAPCGFLWIWKHVASGQKGAPTCSAPRNQCHAAFCGFGSMWQAAKKARQRVLRLEISATRLSVDLEACGKRPKRRANVFCASKSVPRGFLWIWKHVASGQKGAPTCSAPRNQRHAAFCGFGSMWQAAKKARQRVLRLEISATRLSVDLEACGKRPKRRANVFCASKSVPRGFLWIWKHVASGQKGAPTCSAPRNQCHAAFCGFGSMWQAAKKARQRVLRLEISATQLSVDLEACGKRPKRRANVFCASKSAPCGFLWIWKHVASGQKGAPTCSAPRNQRHAAFCGFGSMWQAAKKARQRVLRLEISAMRLSVDLEACGKRPKRRANVFCA